MTVRRIIRRMLVLIYRIPVGGLFLGLVFFALSLTPSLIPRHFLIQSVLSGCVFAAGYGIGVFVEWLWNFMGLKLPTRRWAYYAHWALLAVALAFALLCLWLSTGWQNSIRTVMNMPPVETNQPVYVAAIATFPALVLILIGTLIVSGVLLVSGWLRLIIPPRVALVGGILIVTIITNITVNGMLGRWAFAAADRFYADLDTLAGIYEVQPTDPLRSGSAASLIDWNTIGLDARVYVQSGPTAAEIEAVTGKPAQTPLRVYVGLRSAPTIEERAQLALAEMERIGAFDRSVLVLIMPVGTGWVQPPAIDTLEFLHGGDVASVALQYSYLTSWLSLVSEPNVGVEAARALFDTVYGHWMALPPDQRPELYLHGLSLGAYSSQASINLFDILANPIDGALWVGPPFTSQIWRSITGARDPESPAWLPRVGQGSIVRYANQYEGLDPPRHPWGPLRLFYLQYGSDPVVFFDPGMLYRRPAWLDEPRAPDVSPDLHWYPVVTFLQVTFDLVLAQTSPIGFGHVYAPQHYLKAWIAVTQPEGWTADQLDALVERLSREGTYRDIVGGWFRETR
ncbi:alpha/beta hydrolase [Pelagibacterium lacus]|uniref:Alpha/beta-hydrolase catalytic domain-containing protein n=1 Tax=Pelagibacterium lacus TaxID=2282655 RepID=A0A369W678_9HYPH|nr:alpha/beta-hydrolase family protein [Pelagibacterium lacus]RDE09843.1 hypothetical protein DVH29_04730 [Pelagibacterium lacus]